MTSVDTIQCNPRGRKPTSKEIENWEKEFLPSRDIGVLVFSTSQGVLSHRDVREKKIGGRLLAFVY